MHSTSHHYTVTHHTVSRVKLCSQCPQDQNIDRKLPQLKLSMFKPASTVDYPCLKSKAAISRALVGPMTAVCEDVFQVGSHVTNSYRLMRDFLSLCQKSDVVPTPKRADLLQKTMMQFLASYTCAAQRQAKSSLAGFNLTFKFHLSSHIGDNAKWEVPTYSTEYEFEDMAGKVARTSSTCTRSLSSERVAKKVMSKLLLVSRLYVTRACGRV